MPYLYQSKQWQSLDLIDRAQLLLVIEGLKKGCFVTYQKSLPEILVSTGLDFAIEADSSIFPTIAIARPNDLREYLQNKINPNPDQHFVEGDFLSYPDCCTWHYDFCKSNNVNHQSFLDLGELSNSGKNYPSQLDYRPLSFIPCKVSCKKALTQLNYYKEALLTLDNAAAKDIMFQNRSARPYNKFHNDYLRQEFLRRSCDNQTKAKQILTQYILCLSN